MTREHGVAYHGFYVIGSVGASSRGCQSFHNAAVHREGPLVVYAVTDAVNINRSGIYSECCTVLQFDSAIGVTNRRAVYRSSVNSYGRVNIMAVLAADQNLRSTASAYCAVTVDRSRVFYRNLCSVHNGDSAGFSCRVIPDLAASSDFKRTPKGDINTAAACVCLIFIDIGVFRNCKLACVAVSAGINSAAVTGSGVVIYLRTCRKIEIIGSEINTAAVNFRFIAGYNVIFKASYLAEFNINSAAVFCGIFAYFTAG